MKNIILSILFITSALIANDLPAAKIISTSDCNEINLHVNFKINSNEIEQNSLSRIRNFAKYMLVNTSKSAEIAGYTDSRGSDFNNLALSQRRAQTVYNQLIEDGVSEDRLSHVGYGEENPVASNETPSGRRANRRIEANLF